MYATLLITWVAIAGNGTGTGAHTVEVQRGAQHTIESCEREAQRLNAQKLAGPGFRLAYCVRTNN
jgi:hypothetical protein